MSLLTGCWLYNGTADSYASLQQMYMPIKDFPHEKYMHALQGPVGFGYLLTYNTPEAKNEAMPAVFTEIPLLFMAEGRIDNRAELISLLGLKDNGRLSDGFIISQSYLQWGRQCVHYLKGNWTLAAFDLKEKELFIALDPVGCSALYYYQDDTGFYFSASVKSILALSNYKKELNELHFVRHLTMWDDTKTDEDTYFKHIHKIPLGHTLTLKNKTIAVSRYWNPQNKGLKHYKNKQEYSDEMLEIFTRAVKSRLRSHGGVASMLSGGLDSGSVAYIASELLKQQNTALQTLSHVPLFPDALKQDKISEVRIVDERPNIIKIVNASGNIQPTFLNSENYSILKGLVDSINICDFPLHGASNLYWLLDIYTTTANKGCSTLLNGGGGNGTISFAGTDYLLPWRLQNFVLHPYKFCRNQIAKPIAKAYFNKFLNRKREISNSLTRYVTNIYLREAILDKYDIVTDIERGDKEIHKRIKDIHEDKIAFTSLFSTKSEYGKAFGNYLGIELRDPTTDMDVIDFGFTVPNEVYFDEHYNTRMLVKRMMKGKLPDNVIFEKKRGLQSADIVYRVRAQAGEITNTIQLLQKSPAVTAYIDTTKMEKDWQLYLHQPNIEPQQVQRFLKALQFALFLQIHFD